MAQTTRTIRDYRPQHDEDCNATCCSVCGGGADEPQHRYEDDHHRFTRRDQCSCGLDALLASPDPRIAEARQTVEEARDKAFWTVHAYTMGDAYNSNVYNALDALIATVREADQREIARQEGIIGEASALIGSYVEAGIKSLLSAADARCTYEGDYAPAVRYYARANRDAAALLQHRLDALDQVGSVPVSAGEASPPSAQERSEINQSLTLAGHVPVEEIEKSLEEWLAYSVRCGLLFGRLDEPLDDYGKRIVREIIAALRQPTGATQCVSGNCDASLATTGTSSTLTSSPEARCDNVSGAGNAMTTDKPTGAPHGEENGRVHKEANRGLVAVRVHEAQGRSLEPHQVERPEGAEVQEVRLHEGGQRQVQGRQQVECASVSAQEPASRLPSAAQKSSPSNSVAQIAQLYRKCNMGYSHEISESSPPVRHPTGRYEKFVEMLCNHRSEDLIPDLDALLLEVATASSRRDYAEASLAAAQRERETKP